MANSGTVRSGSAHTLRSLYEAAWREVVADPAAAVRKYQPDWSIALPSGKRVGAGLHRLHIRTC